MNKRIGKIFNVAIHVLEYVIAIMTLAVLVGLIVFEVIDLFTVEGLARDMDTYLQTILSIVVGLEFVRMLTNLTPANVIEVLIVAMARQVIIAHNGFVEILICIVCIALLFAVRKFLISRKDLTRSIGEENEAESEEVAQEAKEKN